MKKILLAAAVSAAFGISGVQAAEDITVDVAVIGAGGAGLSAAVEAANLGAKVVVVEKMAMAGGNTIRAAGGLNAPCTSLQAAKGCLLYTSDAADDMQCVDLGGRRIIKKNFFKQKTAYEISECLVGSEMCIRDRIMGGI